MLLLQKQSLYFDLYEELTHFLQTLFSFPLDIMKVKSNHPQFITEFNTSTTATPAMHLFETAF